MYTHVFGAARIGVTPQQARELLREIAPPGSSRTGIDTETFIERFQVLFISAGGGLLDRVDLPQDLRSLIGRIGRSVVGIGTSAVGAFSQVSDLFANTFLYHLSSSLIRINTHL